MLMAHSMTNYCCVHNSFKQLMLWFVVNTDLTITTEKLMELFATMKDVFVDVDSMRLELQLSWSKSSKIKKRYQNLTRRKESYLDLYVSDHPCPSWRQVSVALRSVGLPHQADEVERTYVEGSIVYRHSHCLSGSSMSLAVWHCWI